MLNLKKRKKRRWLPNETLSYRESRKDNIARLAPFAQGSAVRKTNSNQIKSNQAND